MNKVAKLTEKQQSFVKEYIVDLNATQAYLRSKYSCSNDNTAGKEGHKLLKKPEIQAAIAAEIEKRNKRVEIDADYVLKRLVEIDQLDVLDILDANLESFKPISEWPKAWRQSITGLDLKKMIQYGKDSDDDDVSILQKVKWPDKVKNLELLGKHVDVQAFKEKVDIEATQTHNVMLVPSCTNVDDWEAQAQQQQSEILGDK